jgi:cell division septal protein FtsQ
VSRVTVTRRGMPATTAGVSTPADRHYRRSDPRLTRRRRVGQIALRAIRAVVGPAAILAIAAWGVMSVAESSLLDVTRIAIHGTVRLSPAEIEALLTGLRGENILRVDFEQYRRQVMESPWVASVSLARVLPSTVDVQITERQPIAIARLAQQLYLVDGTGVIIDAYGPQYRDFDLPIVDGLIEGGGRGAISPARVETTMRLLAALDERPDLRARVSQIDIADARDAVVLLGDETARLHLGDRDFVSRLQMWLEIAPTLHEQMSEIDYVDLRFGTQVFARAAGQLSTIRRTALTGER